jgi:putative DNA primase/helicase
MTDDDRFPRPAWSRLERVAGMRVSDAACLYAAMGLHPIALHGIGDGVCLCHKGSECGNPGKHPIGLAWQDGPLRYNELADYLHEHPACNLGLRMGRQPGGLYLVAIDIDGDRSLLEPLEREHGPLPPTLTARTARGLHMIFRSRVPMKNRARIVPRVDTRADGGQIVAAPSVHASGTRYQWINITEPAVLP